MIEQFKEMLENTIEDIPEKADLIKSASVEMEALLEGVDMEKLADWTDAFTGVWDHPVGSPVLNRDGNRILHQDTFGQNVSGSAAKALGAAGATALVGLSAIAMSKAIKAVGNAADRLKFERTLKTVIERNVILQQEDYEKVKSFADTIYRYGPNIAQDPNILANVLTHSVRGESMDVETMRAVTDLEKRYLDNNPSVAAKLLK